MYHRSVRKHAEEGERTAGGGQRLPNDELTSSFLAAPSLMIFSSNPPQRP